MYLSYYIPCQILTEISGRILASSWLARLPRNLGGQKFTEIPGEILKSKNGDQKLAEILAEISKSRRYSHLDLDGQKLAENLGKISSKILARSQIQGSLNIARNLGET